MKKNDTFYTIGLPLIVLSLVIGGAFAYKIITGGQQQIQQEAKGQEKVNLAVVPASPLVIPTFTPSPVPTEMATPTPTPTAVPTVLATPTPTPNLVQKLQQIKTTDPTVDFTSIDAAASNL